QARLQGRSLVGGLFTRAVARAMAVNEVNAAMGLISASPTAGAAGVVPGVLLALGEEDNLTDEQLIEGLLVTGGVGMVMAGNASISGAQGGCMAETGSAAAMAAAAVVELRGGTPNQAIIAAGIALKNTLGLVCDPIAGLVEAPCIKRNAQGVGTALVAAELALAGVGSLIPPDEVVEAAARVGEAMPSALKETARGGLADTPTGRAIRARLHGEPEA
ncbi:MAG: L-serine ammonia-lyase, iron-sulfur-dependent, subunit alpha, partial [Mycobacterium leprae]